MEEGKDERRELYLFYLLNQKWCLLLILNQAWWNSNYNKFAEDDDLDWSYEIQEEIMPTSEVDETENLSFDSTPVVQTRWK